ncbi:hypothetical protein LJR034_004530 [Caballeronia sp. LjRoot34]|uniref:hypothetical protein n=1 Tax=Caballeronia sp. LjRoot34 TaxID=3342325 RepID=UPI003ED16F66
MAIVLVASWAITKESTEIDARQYASLAEAYPQFPQGIKHELSESMKEDKISKSRYAALTREAMNSGVVLDWPQTPQGVAEERARLKALIEASRD